MPEAQPFVLQLPSHRQRRRLYSNLASWNYAEERVQQKHWDNHYSQTAVNAQGVGSNAYYYDRQDRSVVSRSDSFLKKTQVWRKNDVFLNTTSKRFKKNWKHEPSTHAIFAKIMARVCKRPYYIAHEKWSMPKKNKACVIDEKSKVLVKGFHNEKPSIDNYNTADLKSFT